MVFRCRSKWLAKLSDPWVRLVDPLVGEAVGMRVDVDLEDGTTAAGVYVHKKLSDCVGELRDALSAAVLDTSGCCGLVEPATLGKSMTCNL